jgi:alginate O-acetyltransferase complex protein AlgI
MTSFLSILKENVLYNAAKPLLFTQFFFWVFFLLVLFGYGFFYKNIKVRNNFLLAVSLYFYYKTGGIFIFLLLISIVSNFYLGEGIRKSDKRWQRRFYLTLSVFVSLGILAYFKYAYLVTDCINYLFGAHFKVVDYLAVWTNAFTGSHFNISAIVLPVGISFFTFQSLSYTIDLYRRQCEPVKDVFDFGFFISFFPQLVAGPILRASDFIPQMYSPYFLTRREMGHALFLIVNGLIKKMIISDYISINFVDRVFDNPLSYSGFENLMSVYGYTLQIYCDFSGYTDIAIGLALLMGFHIPLNFNSPYKATSLTDFWHRWHISLSSWLRDYLYIPLGGNRKGKVRTYINLMLTMLLGGLWHGASLRFVIWGGIHGAGLVVDKLRFKYFGVAGSGVSKIFSTVITFHLVAFAWIFFRADSMQHIKDMLLQISTHFYWNLIPQMIVAYRIVFSILLLGFVIHWLPSTWKEQTRGWFIITPVYLKVVFAVLVVILIYQFKSSVLQPFIYFQF